MRVILAFLGVSTWLLIANTANANFVVNGGFESGDFTGWNYSSKMNFSFVDSGFSHNGDYAAFFGDFLADGGGSISQNLNTVANDTYLLSFWLAGNGDTPSGLSAIVGGSTLFQILDPPFDAHYKNYTVQFTANSLSTVLQFQFYDDQSYINIDDISVERFSVPEPSGIIGFVVGSIVIICYTRRKTWGM